MIKWLKVVSTLYGCNIIGNINVHYTESNDANRINLWDWNWIYDKLKTWSANAAQYSIECYNANKGVKKTPKILPTTCTFWRYCPLAIYNYCELLTFIKRRFSSFLLHNFHFLEYSLIAFAKLRQHLPISAILGHLWKSWNLGLLDPCSITDN